MDIKNGQTLALKSDWLATLTANSQNSSQKSGTYYGNTVHPTSTGLVDYNWIGQYCYPYTQTTYVTSPAPRPIKLKLSEIDKLRKAAKADKALRDILAKFTHQIEITVDFD